MNKCEFSGICPHYSEYEKTCQGDSEYCGRHQSFQKDLIALSDAISSRLESKAKSFEKKLEGMGLNIHEVNIPKNHEEFFSEFKRRLKDSRLQSELDITPSGFEEEILNTNKEMVRWLTDELRIQKDPRILQEIENSIKNLSFRGGQSHGV